MFTHLPGVEFTCSATEVHDQGARDFANDSSFDITVSVINHRNPDLLRSALASIHEAAGGLLYEVVVVDNAITTDAIPALRAEFPFVRWLLNDRPQGFSANHNRALAVARGKYICVLNDDTILHPNSIYTMAEVLDSNERIAAVGPKLLNEDGSQQDSVFTFPTILHELPHMLQLPAALNRWKSIGVDRRQEAFDYVNVDWVLGACILMRAKAIDRLGNFDEARFPVVYMEEVDWCRRASDAGLLVGFVPQAEVVHLGGQSTEIGSNGFVAMSLILRDARIAYFRKHHGPVAAALIRLLPTFLLPWNLLMLVQSLLRRRIAQAQFMRVLKLYTRL